MHSSGGTTCVEADPNLLACGSATFLDIQWAREIDSGIREKRIFLHPEFRQRWRRWILVRLTRKSPAEEKFVYNRFDEAPSLYDPKLRSDFGQSVLHFIVHDPLMRIPHNQCGQKVLLTQKYGVLSSIGNAGVL